MKKQAIAPAAIVTLKEAFTTVYRDRSDLRSFLTHAIADPSLLARLNWQDHKRNIVTSLVEFMARPGSLSGRPAPAHDGSGADGGF